MFRATDIQGARALSSSRYGLAPQRQDVDGPLQTVESETEPGTRFQCNCKCFRNSQKREAIAVGMKKKRFWKEETLDTFFFLTCQEQWKYIFRWLVWCEPLVGARFKKRPQTWHRLDTGSLEETGNKIGRLENKAAWDFCLLKLLIKTCLFPLNASNNILG